MMNYPPLNELVSKINCRYMLVSAVAKRARRLMAEPDKIKDRKPVSVAIEELWEDKLVVRSQENN
ncbi:MAG: DNA-directed RNA polymerase subunit omega [Firmicutes bacterium ADurb.Bin182]|nr:MAG: DNA-directed RNA polymerase subunit omega [Firmicutes bacterium ADurb.Bin182]